MSALKSDTIGWSQEKPKLSHLRVGLSCAWSLYHTGDTIQGELNLLLIKVHIKSDTNISKPNIPAVKKRIKHLYFNLIALKICGQLLNNVGLHFNTDSLITTMGDIYYLAALSRQAGTSFQVTLCIDA